MTRQLDKRVLQMISIAEYIVKVERLTIQYIGLNYLTVSSVLTIIPATWVKR